MNSEKLLNYLFFCFMYSRKMQKTKSDKSFDLSDLQFTGNYAPAFAFFASLDFNLAALFLWIKPFPAALSSFITAVFTVCASAASALAFLRTVFNSVFAALLRAFLTFATKTLFFADLIFGTFFAPP